MAMSEGMPNCDPVLLEPIYEVTISVPSEFTNKVHSLVSARRGQILGFEMRRGGKGWDDLKCHLPEAELQVLITAQIGRAAIRDQMGKSVWFTLMGGPIKKRKKT